ncbi:hypothetical protein BCV72DRAFT_228185 [Rhizopus microsporus var. microsporus]|uniref:Integrase zinc-binding domain-containing protein n=2 Tax=Rhizopus microsporus TaxID=58291 RepID=A0A2G4T9S4_RHIZD|nr:uncharacterized protein RHIMIDRAFT_254746 [Rhizopus microsporus ATCC 52813]ORE06532.1 hypothetical protein BCV72DRAFT_228185 [Rhizopus microsporus var. microsporus]PHZ17757.1 hypothetical protein RHIMIDRAFT_254746 [Rhizopus microsporus ATCC 52813]
MQAYVFNDFNTCNNLPPISLFESLSNPPKEDDYGFTTMSDFQVTMQDYLDKLHAKKRDKALIDFDRYRSIEEILKNPSNTAISTAQFRYWAKKMFELSAGETKVVCHNGKPVAIKETIYEILLDAHKIANHGGRDKTSAIVKGSFSWIPKELIARFVRCCPTCRFKRNGNHLDTFDSCSPPYATNYSDLFLNAVPTETSTPSTTGVFEDLYNSLPAGFEGSTLLSGLSNFPINVQYADSLAWLLP